MMMNHAAYVEYENADIRWKHKKTVEEWIEKKHENDPVLEEFGCRLSELSDEMKNAYLADWSDFG